MGNFIIKIYNDMLDSAKNGDRIIYYGASIFPAKFEDLTIDHIEGYFRCGEKENCISEEQKDYFSQNNNRVKHMFSIYLLGIYCYDRIMPIKNAFNRFIENKIRKNIKEDNTQNKDECLRNDFLYLWFLTALYHDMGYLYENKGDNDASLYSFIIERKNMMSNDNLGFYPVSGIPRNLQLAAAEYFWNRRNNIFFNENLCTDHGFAGGFKLYTTLKKLHQERGKESVKPVEPSGLQFGMPIFQWYNVPSAWAIICHNIWLAEGGSGLAVKYEALNLDKLIYLKGDSPVKLKNHPLLFLLDFVDTIDPEKCFGNTCEKATISSGTRKLSISLNCPWTDNKYCSCFSEKIKKLDKDMDFLKSDLFHTETSEQTISFLFSA